MKRLIASFAVLGLIAAPALATTRSAMPTTAAAKPTRAQLKAAKKAARVNKAAPGNAKKSG
ncbi:MAG: hypothetical protein ACJ8D6_07140 [Sphingomicrobium sp.]